MAEPALSAHAAFDAAGFRAFLETRPDGERWELIEGVAMQSAAPRIAHQRIASNFERHLNAALRLHRPAWRADREIGIEVSSRSRYRPEPEVTVIDAATDTERSYTDRFYLVMEVPSASDRGRVLERKIAFYRAHPHNRFILIVEQDALAATLHVRSDSETWHVETLSRPGDAIVLGELGAVCTLAEIYADTHLDPRRL
ncbi:Uma2 family endonuclease [Methylobacterium sp. NEAU 140]|uniref:Uma2 family endonuclease n=1 Tax=Methylobacterium sp. NEAU 140 TaxID=3064945 RepID=UPI0027346CB9|nr:Uma2 family endonuclease [Methylobacterium sp. NEAU 140]MDP4023849.1 Uma2 family endonuclease [Methylobacterium sp. NEAU 140]